ncbi:hypothetical protein SD70_01135 [Gordoniibacillus kamchatkensis]|uniref:Transcriptional regulator n=1 Tax=Gordoniibacillus kamchatkensis TaxID=1590651 RepID=A0ABR5APR3_9BACL|nr:cache domain-containing protein [Paenibacillus sp. VKM B-2647]KIL42520.1 hypothetical protein SD70_01135 [Paenibacillus sp. VKM B-2647]
MLLWIQSAWKKQTFYMRSLVLVLVITCVPVSLLGISLYYFGSGRIASEFTKAHQIELKQSVQRVDDYLSHLELFVAQLAFNPGFDESLNQLDFAQQFNRTNDLLKSLMLMRESNPLIENVFLYLKDSNKLISYDSGVRTIETDEDKRIFSSLLDRNQTIYYLPELKQIHMKDKEYHTVVIKLPNRPYQQSFGAFLLYLNPEVLNRLLQKLIPGTGTSFLLDEKGDYVTSPVSYEGNPNLELAGSLRQRVMNQDVQNDTFIYKWKGEAYSVSYEKLNRLGTTWTFLSATPLSQVLSPVSAMSKFILSVSTAGLAIALLLSWFASKKIYDPIRRLKEKFLRMQETAPAERDDIAFIERQWIRQLQESEMMNKRLNESIPSLRDGFLNQIVQGNHNSLSEHQIVDKLRQLNWDIGGKLYAILVVHLYGVSNSGKFSENDEQLLSFATTNIMKDVCAPLFPMFHTVLLDDLTIGVLVISDDRPRDELKEKLKTLGNQLMTTLSHVLQTRVTVTVSRITGSILDAPLLLEQSQHALRYRNVLERNQILDLDNLAPIHTEEPSSYPLELEREIVVALSLGMKDETIRLIRQFLSVLTERSATEMAVHQGMTKLLSSLLDTISARAQSEPCIRASICLRNSSASANRKRCRSGWKTSSFIRFCRKCPAPPMRKPCKRSMRYWPHCHRIS